MVRPTMNRKVNPAEPVSDLDNTVLAIDRVSRTVKGGRRIRFRALVIVGDRNGRVGMGIGKGTEVAIAVNKATTFAKKHLINVPIVNGTISHEITIEHGSTKIFLKPASEGTSIIAGSAVRTIAELAGIRNLVSKVIGSSNKINNSYTTFLAFKSLSQEKQKGKEYQ